LELLVAFRKTHKRYALIGKCDYCLLVYTGTLIYPVMHPIEKILLFGGGLIFFLMVSGKASKRLSDILMIFKDIF